jgi:hypothetical protein
MWYLSITFELVNPNNRRNLLLQTRSQTRSSRRGIVLAMGFVCMDTRLLCTCDTVAQHWHNCWHFSIHDCMLGSETPRTTVLFLDTESANKRKKPVGIYNLQSHRAKHFVLFHAINRLPQHFNILAWLINYSVSFAKCFANFILINFAKLHF